mgnify:CR=1 FL=1
MSDFTDEILGRYLDRDAATRRAYHLDPRVHADVERLRQLVDAAERAMLDEGVVDKTRERVINRIVFGAPEGSVYPTRWGDALALATLPMPTVDV